MTLSWRVKTGSRFRASACSDPPHLDLGVQYTLVRTMINSSFLLGARKRAGADDVWNIFNYGGGGGRHVVLLGVVWKERAEKQEISYIRWSRRTDCLYNKALLSITKPYYRGCERTKGACWSERFNNRFICVGVDSSIYALLTGERSSYSPV